MDVHSLSTANPIVRMSRYFPNKVALISISENKRVTYGELNRRANRLANALIDLGVRKGDLVATFMLNTVSAVEARLATYPSTL